MTDKWQLVELKEGAFIPFVWKDLTPGGSNLGRAEFQVCLKFKYGKTSEFWVYPRQQRVNTCWHYVTDGYYDFTINSYQGLENAGAWLYNWCKEHKCTTFNIYVPPYSQFLEITRSGLSFWKNHLF